jgi:hypothetical protein
MHTRVLSDASVKYCQPFFFLVEEREVWDA